MVQLTSQALLADTLALLRQGVGRATIALVVLTAMGVFADMAAPTANQLNFLISAAGLAMQYWLSGVLLKELGLRQVSGARFWQMFGVCLLTNIGILLGFVFLIVPGIILLVRWSISVPYVISDDQIGVIEAIQRSWEETGDAFWPILLTLLIFYLPVGLASFAAGYFPGFETGNAISSIAFNLFLNAGLIGGWHVAVAVFGARRPESRLAETFA